jgi:hypothetical protein
MAQTIQIKRSSSTNTPTSLSAGELAYSDSSDKLFIGQPSNNTVVTIGGKAFVDKLDGIESGATADQTASEIRTLVESASDSNVFTDADHTKLNGIAANANNFSLDTASTTTLGGVKLFNDTDVTESGVNSVSTTAGRYYGVQLTQNNKMVVNVPWSGGSLSTTLGVGNTTGGNNIVFGDSSGTSDDRLVFGAGSDLQIYHDGDHSVIEDAGTGNLKLICQDLEVIDQSDNKLFSSNSSAETIFFAAGSDDALKVKNAAVEVIARPLKVNDIEEYTSGHGVEIDSVTLKDGGVTATSLDINGNADISGNLTLTGNLNITGDVNSQNVTDLDVTDKTITVGVGQTAATSSNSGITVAGANAKIVYEYNTVSSSGKFEIDQGDGSQSAMLTAANWGSEYTGAVDGGTF